MNEGRSFLTKTLNTKKTEKAFFDEQGWTEKG